MKQALSEWLNDHPKMKKCLESYDLTDITIIGGKFDESRGSSFFYDGVVYELQKGHRQIEINACGEIRIHKNGELVFDCKERNEGFGFKVETDEDLKKVNEENGFEWGMNNWFEYGYKREDQESFEYILGDVGYDLEEAFSQVILQLQDDDFWAIESEEMLNIIIGKGYTFDEDVGVWLSDHFQNLLSVEENLKNFAEYYQDENLEYLEYCENCKHKMNPSFRFTDWEEDRNDQYGTYDECVEMLKKAIQEEPEIRASVYDVSECPECEYFRDEGIVFNEKCPTYKSYGGEE